MPNCSSRPKRPRDPNVRAKLIVDIATGQVEAEKPDDSKNADVTGLRRLGQKNTGKARKKKKR